MRATWRGCSASALSWGGTRQGETRGPKPDMVYINAEGVQKNVKALDAKLVHREVKGAAVGKTMRVAGGTHAGLLCEVLAVEPQVRAWAAPVLLWHGGALTGG